MWSTRTTRLLAACDSFKGTLPSYKVGEAIEAGYHRYSQEAYPDGLRPRFTHCPMSDGGAGLLDSLTHEAGRGISVAKASEQALNLKRILIPDSAAITGPLGTPLSGTSAPVSFACDVVKGVIVVEMAEASGLPRILDPRERNPLRTTSYGTGEVIRYALQYLSRESPESAKRGVRLYLGIGGSATNDGGLGALQALGLDVFVSAAAATGDREARLDTPFCGADLARITRVHISDALRATFLTGAGDAATAVRVKEVHLICDVDNPLVGPRGATYTFGPQKCSPASADRTRDVEDTAVGEVRGDAQRQILDSLEAGMTHAAEKTAASLWQDLERQRCQGSGAAVAKTASDYTHELLHAAGGGGAGGMSGFFRFVLGATCLPGADAVAELLNLRIPTGADPTAASSSSLLSPPFTGLLYTNCDVLATGEGSFDSQTVYSHKTVGRLLEMAVEANIYHQLQHSASGSAARQAKLVKGVLVLCGRCGFRTPEVCQSEIETALVKTLLPNLSSQEAPSAATHTPLERAVLALQKLSQVSSTEAVVKAAMPRICVIPLAPHRFSIKEAMTNPFPCVQEAVYQFLKASDTQSESNSFAPNTGKPQRPSSL